MNGDPEITGSWTQNFDAIDGIFDTLEIFVVGDEAVDPSKERASKTSPIFKAVSGYSEPGAQA